MYIYYVCMCVYSVYVYIYIYTYVYMCVCVRVLCCMALHGLASCWNRMKAHEASITEKTTLHCFLNTTGHRMR